MKTVFYRFYHVLFFLLKAYDFSFFVQRIGLINCFLIMFDTWLLINLILFINFFQYHLPQIFLLDIIVMENSFNKAILLRIYGYQSDSIFALGLKAFAFDFKFCVRRNYVLCAFLVKWESFDIQKFFNVASGKHRNVLKFYR